MRRDRSSRREGDTRATPRRLTNACERFAPSWTPPDARGESHSAWDYSWWLASPRYSPPRPPRTQSPSPGKGRVRVERGRVERALLVRSREETRTTTIERVLLVRTTTRKVFASTPPRRSSRRRCWRRRRASSPPPSDVGSSSDRPSSPSRDTRGAPRDGRRAPSRAPSREPREQAKNRYSRCQSYLRCECTARTPTEDGRPRNRSGPSVVDSRSTRRPSERLPSVRRRARLSSIVGRRAHSSAPPLRTRR